MAGEVRRERWGIFKGSNVGTVLRYKTKTPLFHRNDISTWICSAKYILEGNKLLPRLCSLAMYCTSLRSLVPLWKSNL